MALYVVTKISVVKPQLDPAMAFMTLRAHAARSTQSRAFWDEGEIGFQRATLGFWGSLQRDHLVIDSHLWLEPGLVDIRGEQSDVYPIT